MRRIVLLTVGKTHAGKSTFADRLSRLYPSFLVIDQDVHARFLNTHYQKLLPLDGPNHLKHQLTDTIVEHARRQSDLHLIVCNANLSKKQRIRFLQQFPKDQYRTILVYFDLAEEVLLARVDASIKDRAEIRGAEDYRQILSRQRLERPEPDEADQVIRIRTQTDIESFLQDTAWFINEKASKGPV